MTDLIEQARVFAAVMQATGREDVAACLTECADALTNLRLRKGCLAGSAKALLHSLTRPDTEIPEIHIDRRRDALLMALAHDHSAGPYGPHPSMERIR